MLRTTFILIAISLILFSCNKYDEYIKNANDALISKDYDEALFNFNNAFFSAKTDLDRGKVKIYMGYIMTETFAYNAALEYYEEASKLLVNNDKELGMAFRNMGLIYGRLKKVELAELYTIKAIKLYSNDKYLTSKARNGLGVAYKKSGLYSKALEQFNLAITNDKMKAEVYNNIGNCFLSMGKIDSSILYLKHALKLGVKKNYITHTNLAKAYYSKGDIHTSDSLAYLSLVPENKQIDESYLLLSNIESLKNPYKSKDFINKYAQHVRNERINSLKSENEAIYYQIQTARLIIEMDERQRVFESYLITIITLLIATMVAAFKMYNIHYAIKNIILKS